MKDVVTEAFVHPYIPNTAPAVKQAMLDAVGAESVEDFYADVPEDLRLRRLLDVPAPLLGNFYEAPRPGDPPFVKPGDKVDEETIIGIIEVMKLMNPIRAGVSGTVVAILAQNGSAVEEGEALIRVKVER